MAQDVGYDAASTNHFSWALAATGYAKPTSPIRVATTPTVNQTAGGLAFGEQLVPLSATKPSADAMLAPYVCDTSKGKPGDN